MVYAKNIGDIERNAFSFLDDAHDSDIWRSQALKMIEASKVFFPIEYRGLLAFVPSRFIGYRDNSVEKHIAARDRDTAKKRKLREAGQKLPSRGWERDGKDTNPAVSSILGIPEADADTAIRLDEFCRSLGGTLHKNEHTFWSVERVERFEFTHGSAINDIVSHEIGNDSPEYKRRMAGVFIRDPEVRRQVLRRANGICEFGGCPTFQKVNGQAYLEAHHVISLSEEGKDKLSNVIALCPNHHREAHFGERWQSLQDEFLHILKKLAP